VIGLTYFSHANSSVRFCLMGVAVVLCSRVYCQDINFDDLRRGASKPLVQSVVVPGLGEQADRYMGQFSEVDRSRSEARAEARRRYAESASTYSAGTESSGGSGFGRDSGKRQSDVRIWRCKVYCKSAGGPITWKEVPAKTRGDAARWVGDNADAICNADGNSYASSKEFSAGQCSEK
jgi:hypothetical protein